MYGIWVLLKQHEKFPFSPMKEGAEKTYFETTQAILNTNSDSSRYCGPVLQIL